MASREQLEYYLHPLVDLEDGASSSEGRQMHLHTRRSLGTFRKKKYNKNTNRNTIRSRGTHSDYFITFIRFNQALFFLLGFLHAYSWIFAIFSHCRIALEVLLPFARQLANEKKSSKAPNDEPQFSWLLIIDIDFFLHPLSWESLWGSIINHLQNKTYMKQKNLWIIHTFRTGMPFWNLYPLIWVRIWIWIQICSLLLLCKLYVL